MKGSQKSKKKKLQKSTANNSNPYLHAVIFLGSLTVILLFLNIFFVGKILTSQLAPLKSQPIKAAPYPSLSKESNPQITAKAAIVYDRKSRVPVFEKNSSTRFTPASTVKIMTALVATESYNPDDILTASGVSSVQGSSMDLVEGENIKVRDLLYGLLLPSGNDAAYTLAVNYPDGGYAGFVKKMNEKAKELRMYNTRYVDPAGYDDANYTTPKDLAHLADTALKVPLIQKVADTKKITVTDTTGTYVHDLSNLNKLLDYADVYGLKTGFTNEAGEVLVTSVVEKGGEYIVVVMKSQDRFRDTQLLMAEIIRNINLTSF